ncbi:MAG: phosphate signaling complex protein PhoU [Planctomycetes bacterium]|nr:phosphate signaling complex protein PhoU [Planctomycetota bacterium]
MTKHLLRDLEHLKKQLLTVGAMVEEAIQKATGALLDRRPELVEQTMRGERQIDEREVAVEEECLKLLALHQPVASDLRFIVTVLKANNDLERMGDLAEAIAERAAFLTSHDPIKLPPAFRKMVENVRTMVREALDSLVNVDVDLARKVLRDDSEVDATNRQMFAEMQELMMRDPQSVPRALHSLSASRALERISDHATNIAEDVLFMVEGEIMRHRKDRGLGQKTDPRQR